VTSTTGAYVLRGVPHYDWQFPAEHFFAQLLHERTLVPVTWPYLLDPTEDIFGWSYALMPRMPGMQLSDPAVAATLSPTDRLAIAQALGENLVLMHRLTWPVPGHYDVTVETIAPFPAGFTAWLMADIRTWLAKAQRHSARTTARDVVWVEALLRAARPALTEPLQPHFVMNDYKEQNTAVSCAAHGWHVTGVFDLMEGFFGDGEMDLVRSVAGYVEEDPRCAQAFLTAYVEHMPPRHGFAERFAVYMLRDRLIVLARRRSGVRSF